MRVHSAVEQEIRDLIHVQGRLTFAQFMHTCLYAPRGGFYTARQERLSAHFGTAPTSHPVFGALIARQLAQMWHLLGEPPVFQVLEVGSGDGTLAQAIVRACAQREPRLAQALSYVAADYAPRWVQAPEGIQRVQTDGLRAFRNVVGCILCNELLDNFPVHRFVIQEGRVQEIFVTLHGGQLTEVLDAPSTPRLAERLASLGVSLPDGYRGEVHLALEDWTAQLASALERGFVLTIDYGQLAADLYAPQNHHGTLVCYHRHAASDTPYQHLGEQDITCQVDFTSLMRLGEHHGLATVGYALQSQFLRNLGFDACLEALETPGLSAARLALSRMAMLALVEPEEYGAFKVLAQAKGLELDGALQGFEHRGT